MPADSVERLARAESLLVTGQLVEARRELETFLRADRDHPGALVLLGRVHLAWPVVGRFKAWRLFERAARAEPENPEPRYWQARVGFFLGSADGESLARTAVHKLWRLVPEYRDTWRIWSQLHRNDRHRREALRLLARYSGNTGIDLRRAQLLIELERWSAADSLLGALAARGRDDAWLWALRAQGALEAGYTANGLRYYQEALDRAASDSTDALWRQIAPIASPDEDSVYRATPLADRGEFFRAFWSRREPDLTTPVNERIAEHFDRLRTARRKYSLRHPLTRFHRSPLRRALAGALAGTVARELQASGFRATFLRSPRAFADEIEALGLSVDVRHVPEPDSLTRYVRFGLDGRGLFYLRFGKPKQVYVVGGLNLGDIETWRYEVDGASVIVPFARASSGGASGFGGDMVLYPTNRRELRNGVALLARDATSIDARGELRVWVASFRDEQRDRQLVYVQGSADTVAAAVWDERWYEVARQLGPGPRRFRLAPGTYHVGVDAHSNGELARIRGRISVPWLWSDRLAISSILVGAGDDRLGDRDAVARAMPGDLEFPVAAPLSLYSEIYNLPARTDGIAEFEVEYRFEPIDGGRPITLSFVRRAPATPTVVEQIVLEPDRVPSGHYRIVLTVRDLLFGVQAQTSRVDLRLR